jgi:hypothetical protein
MAREAKDGTTHIEEGSPVENSAIAERSGERKIPSKRKSKGAK